MPTDSCQFEVFFDGACPFCRREIDWLRRRDKAGAVRFTDIAAEGFEAEETGKTHAELMARIHGRLPDGTLVEGVDVFRRLYTAAGLGGLVTLSRWPIVRNLLDLGYSLFARYRLRLTGRCRKGVCRAA
jgi:predicted DCC family thiol-disulfide oxidoreductase YuxK